MNFLEYISGKSPVIVLVCESSLISGAVKSGLIFCGSGIYFRKKPNMRDKRDWREELRHGHD